MEQYRRYATALREQAASMDPFGRADRMHQFTFFSANLTNFLPDMGYPQHVRLFREARLNQQLSHLDQRYFGGALPYQVAGWNRELADRLKSKPGIICTLHMGSYRLLNYLLAREGVPFVILMSYEASQKQGEEFRQLFKQLRSTESGAQLAIIEAESRNGVWQMMQYIRKGYNLLVYVDGHGGLQTDRDKLIRVPFLAQHLLVRQGVAFIARKMKVPLYPMVCLRNHNGDINVMAGETLESKGMDSPEWAYTAMTWLFAHFQNWVAQRPAQWESWFFMHQQIDPVRMETPESLIIPAPINELHAMPVPDNYGLYTAQGQHYILKKQGYESYPIDEVVFAKLQAVWQEPGRNETAET